MRYLMKLGLAGLAVMALMACVGATASATTLEVGGVTQNTSVSITATLVSGTSLTIKDEFGTTTDTCTGSTIKGATEGTFTAATVGGTVSSLLFASCNHTTHVLSNGSFYIYWTSGTKGVFGLSGSEVTVVSTFFGASAVCKMGAGSALGTVTGTASGNATLDVNATINCGILGNASWTGTYTITSPTGFGVEN